jgi:hypothetical protein
MSAMRSLARGLLLAFALLLVLPASAAAYITAPGDPVRNGATYNALPAEGTCTIDGATTPITELRLSLVSPVSNRVTAEPSGLRYWYQLTAVCGADYVLAELSVPAVWTIDDAAGTLTFADIAVPASFTGETYDGLVGTATLTSGAGTVGPVVYGADTSAERSGVASRHRSIDKAKTAADRALRLTDLIIYLS